MIEQLKSYYDRMTDGARELDMTERAYIRRIILWCERSKWLTKSVKYLLVGSAGAWGLWLALHGAWIELLKSFSTGP